MFKVSNEDTRNDVSHWRQISHLVSIVDFEHAFVCRGNFTEYLLTFDKAVARSSEK